MSRTNNSIKNIKYAVIGQSFALIISFISRMVFVRTLGAEYLGLNGLFLNILSILSLAELGVGEAIIYSLYKPLATKNETKVQILMSLYKKTYIGIGIIIAVVGSALTPFLGFFIKDIPDINNIQLIYLMFVINSSISYFFSYKRSLIIADQKRYIATTYRYGFYFLLNIAQIFILIITKNYILFLLLQIMNTLIENIFISIHANRIYPFLREKNGNKLESNEKKVIIKNVKAMMYHKLGTVIVVGTDNILISKFIGVFTVGLYSNYQLIISALNTVFGLLFQSFTASIGNLGATETEEKTEFIFNSVNFLGFWIYGISSIFLMNLINPFIILWIGKEYIFSMPLVFLIIINFYLSGMRKGVLTFRDALGLFWYDRYKSIFEAAINLVASITLVRYWGISGVFIGTIISTLTTCFWVEPYILFKYGFKKSMKSYFYKYFFYTITMLFAGYITWVMCGVLPNPPLINFLERFLICVFVPNIFFVVVFWRTKEFQYLLNIIKPMIKISIKN